jgi:membrane fusion protein (multidrug efflux system)
MLRRNETSQGQIRMPSPRRAVLAAAALLAAWALPAQAQMGPPGPPTIGTVAAQKRAVTESSEFTGRIQAAARVDVVARVTAFIEARTFTEGGEVQEGELLFRLDPATFQAEVAAREANVAQATALLRNATLTLSRAQALIGSGAGRASAVDDARTQQASLTAQLQAAGAQLRAAQINLGYTEVTAPISGRVGRASLSAGNVVTPASGPLVTIVSQDPMYVTFPVPLRQALELRNRYAERGGFAALRVRVRLPDGRIYAQAGTLDYADPSVAPSTDSLTLRATIPNPVRPGVRPGEPANRDLLDGAFVTVFLEGIEPIRALAIPRAAVLSDPQGSFVYVIDAEKKTQQRRITLAPSPPGLAIVIAGLQEGETIAVDGLQRLRPGVQVNPVPAPPPGGAPAAAPAPRG